MPFDFSKHLKFAFIEFSFSARCLLGAVTVYTENFVSAFAFGVLLFGVNELLFMHNATDVLLKYSD
jgi:hypothetical protein